ncbi:MAG: hypothetical protein ACTSUO_06245 [Candidatus Thorarchaeota archaeon]
MSERSTKPDTIGLLLTIGLMTAGIAVIIVWTIPIILALANNTGIHQFINFDLGMSLFIAVFLLISGYGLYRLTSMDRSRLAIARRHGFGRKPPGPEGDFGSTGDKKTQHRRDDTES